MIARGVPAPTKEDEKKMEKRLEKKAEDRAKGRGRMERGLAGR